MKQYKTIPVTQKNTWRKVLGAFEKVDVCHLPEYHAAYSKREKNAQAIMWTFSENNKVFCYPFLYTPVFIRDGKQMSETGYYDISSIYGYSGPLCNSSDSMFIEKSWGAFDEWSLENGVIAEFIRFSPYAETVSNAHPGSTIEFNRHLAVSNLPDNAEKLMQQLKSKTRNMIRKAKKSGLVAKSLEPKIWLDEFRTLYYETMARNNAPDFFTYDDYYFEQLMILPSEELTLIGVFMEDELVATAMSINYGHASLYHLGASKNDFSSLGAGNLCLYELSVELISKGIVFLNLGGGRTTSEDDFLYKFKRNNATDIHEYTIGKRIVDVNAYLEVKELWAMNNPLYDDNRLIFYR